MVKGIHKQIIEIKCTNSEHFEKILLIARSDHDLPHNRMLLKEASALLEELPPIRHEKRKHKSSGMFSKLNLYERIFVFSICAQCIALLAVICYIL